MSAVLRIFRRRNSYNGIFEESIFRTAQSIDDSHGVHTECFFLGTEKPCDRGIVEYSNICVYIYMYKDGSWSPLHNTNQLFFSRSLVILNAVPGRMYPRLLKLKKILFLQRFCHVFLPIFWEKFHMPPWHLGFFCHRLPPPRRDWLIVVPRKMPKS